MAEAELEAGRKRLNLDGPTRLWQRRRRARVPPPCAPDLAPAHLGPSCPPPHASTCSPPAVTRDVATSARMPSQPPSRGELEPPPPGGPPSPRRASTHCAEHELHAP
jgi:hypothetical protein